VPELEELTSVPFFPQTEYDCGPAALATVLAESGLAITPGELLPKVYTAGLKGSLQAEMLAAARSEGRLPILVEPTTQGLFDLVAAGHPVLVLQNLRLPRSPAWHYAVVVGRESESGRVILRSGEEPRKRQRARRFAQTWSLADNWGFVVVRPGEIPDGVEPERYMRSVIESRRALANADTDAAFEAALSRWPSEPTVLFLNATRLQERAELTGAAELYHRVLAIDSGHVAARNNLANVLLEQGCFARAEQQAQLALTQETAEGPFAAAILDTLAQIETAAAHAQPPAAPAPACS